MNNTLYIRSNTSSVISPYTGKIALWVDSYNNALVDSQSWLISDYSFVSSYRKFNRGDRPCYWLKTKDARILDGNDLYSLLKQSMELSLPDPDYQSSYTSLVMRFKATEAEFNYLILHTDGKLYGLN
jgi:hypothetical protein